MYRSKLFISMLYHKTGMNVGKVYVAKKTVANKSSSLHFQRQHSDVAAIMTYSFERNCFFSVIGYYKTITVFSCTMIRRYIFCDIVVDFPLLIPN